MSLHETQTTPQMSLCWTFSPGPKCYKKQIYAISRLDRKVAQNILCAAKSVFTAKQPPLEENATVSNCVWRSAFPSQTLGSWASTVSHIRADEISSTMLPHVCVWVFEQYVFVWVYSVWLCQCLQPCAQCDYDWARSGFQCCAQAFSCWRWWIGTVDIWLPVLGDGWSDTRGRVVTRPPEVY